MTLENAYILLRDVTMQECKWLKRDFQVNEIVHLYNGNTYNCISKNGKPFTEVENEVPFFELPNDAIQPLMES